MKRTKGEPCWWKAYDFKSGLSYILGEKFKEKGEAMAFARACGMVVISQTVVPVSDEAREIAILKNQLKEERAKNEQAAFKSEIY